MVVAIVLVDVIDNPTIRYRRVIQRDYRTTVRFVSFKYRISDFRRRFSTQSGITIRVIILHHTTIDLPAYHVQRSSRITPVIKVSIIANHGIGDISVQRIYGKTLFRSSTFSHDTVVQSGAPSQISATSVCRISVLDSEAVHHNRHGIGEIIVLGNHTSFPLTIQDGRIQCGVTGRKGCLVTRKSSIQADSLRQVHHGSERRVAIVGTLRHPNLMFLTIRRCGDNRLLDIAERRLPA